MKLSTKALSVGLPGLEKSSVTHSDYRSFRTVGQCRNHKAAGDKGRRSEGLTHGIDSFHETNASRPVKFIKSESEPLLRAV